MSPSTAYVALGGNLGDRLTTLRSAVTQLAAHPAIDVRRRSSVYETAPVGPSNEPFLNATLGVSTELDPLALLEVLHDIERVHGRKRRVRWDARTLDLDLLLFFAPGQDTPLVSEDPRCRLPHPSMLQRDFVLTPLVDLAPALILEGRTLTAHLSALPDPQRTVLASVGAL
ncbi:MAG: 2-amino-4-hydroxy-6-hydroxymethyldihydropteridine diphosphokinase [Nannocystaceae bacterium]|nr:2-amino-4-hydroxy-6-hydroxymethyldihydropteridine diphosphokinase [Nannocystaceae bacterium]